MENETILIDTSILIDYFRKKEKQSTTFYKLFLKYKIAVSSVTEFEFLAGAKEEHFEFVDTLFKKLTVLPFDSECAKKAKNIYLDLKSKNKLIELPDIFIASTALANSLLFSTINEKHFKRIEGLNFVD